MKDDPFTEPVTLRLSQCIVIAEALVSYALRADSTDERIRQVIDALRSIGYSYTADTLANLQYSVRA